MTVQSEHTTTARSFKHLSLAERGMILALLREARSIRYIAASLQRSPSTIVREIRRGTTEQLRTGQPDWQAEVLVCSKTLYHYIDRCRLSVRNIDLPLKVRRKSTNQQQRKNKRILGPSIEQRPDSVLSRQEFGHWEIDTLVGRRSQDEVLLTITERKTRQEIVMRMPQRDSESVESVMKALQKRMEGSFAKVFRSITADNGSEFAGLSDLVALWGCQVYFSHPYSSWERGTNERHNGLLRRFIPKTRNIRDLSASQIRKAQDWCNQLPRKMVVSRILRTIAFGKDEPRHVNLLNGFNKGRSSSI